MRSWGLVPLRFGPGDFGPGDFGRVVSRLAFLLRIVIAIYEASPEGASNRSRAEERISASGGYASRRSNRSAFHLVAFKLRCVLTAYSTSTSSTMKCKSEWAGMEPGEPRSP